MIELYQNYKLWHEIHFLKILSSLFSSLPTAPLSVSTAGCAVGAAGAPDGAVAGLPGDGGRRPELVPVVLLHQTLVAPPPPSLAL